MQSINGTPRQRVILSKKVREDFVIVPPVVRKHSNHARDVLGNGALWVKEGRGDQTVSLRVTPSNELAGIEQVKDAGDRKIELLSYVLERQQLLASEQLGQLGMGILFRVRRISHRHNCSGITL